MELFISKYTNIFKSPPKISHLDIILENNGENTEPSIRNNYTSLDDELKESFLTPISKPPTTNKTSPTSKAVTSPPTSPSTDYKPPNKNPPTSSQLKEESPFSKFKIWGQQS